MGYADPARQFALEQASHEWILVVDADELIPRPLADYLKGLARQGEYDAVWIPRLNYMFGKEITHTGWEALHDKQMRFFKKSVMSYGDKIHDFVNLKTNARTQTLTDKSLSIVHFNYLDSEHFIDKLNRYTTIEATLGFKNKRPTSAWKAASRFAYEFFKRFVLLKGYKDGYEGLCLALLMGTYRASSEFKLHLMNTYDTATPRDRIEAKYQDIARSINHEYD